MPQTGQGWGQVLHQMLTTLTPATLFFLKKIVLNLDYNYLWQKGKKDFEKTNGKQG